MTEKEKQKKDEEVDIEKLCREVMRHEMKAVKKTEKIIRESDVEERTDAMSNVVSEMINNAESVEMKLKIYQLLYNVGRSFGSDVMQEAAIAKIEEMRGGDGSE